MHISSIPLRTHDVSSHSEDAFIFPDADTTPHADPEAVPPPTGSVVSLISSNHSVDSLADLAASTTTIESTPAGTATPRGRQGPSGLSLLLARQLEAVEDSPGSSSTPTPTLEYPNGRLPTDPASNVRPPVRPALSPVVSFVGTVPNNQVSMPSETTPLLVDLEAGHHDNGRISSSKKDVKDRTSRIVSLLRRPHAPHITPRDVKNTAVTAIQSLPAVLLGTLLNILDGVSCAYVFSDHVGRR